MAVKIRLRRTGAKNQPSYRLVVVDGRSPRDGRFIEVIGHYNPRRHNAEGEPELVIRAERALYWLDHGAQPTDTARSLLRRYRILELRHDRDHGIDISERLAELESRRWQPGSQAAAEEAPTAAAEQAEAPGEEATPETPAEA